ncbi:RIP metalloprotease RseP [Terriglobus tenax]|uniref:RIP metalloprotease RseP n=1 Tax=Terriglobus tenax TaxID=1111115 RepID=UPI0021E0538D|nr:RIP metalloprotease RseP [Terriglobus tenax]
MTTLIYLAIVLGVMVLIHELGHFLAAKWCGVRVETFSIGFGKRLFGFRRGDTDYRVSVLPFGGYVKMAGDNPGEEPSGDPGEFNAHPRWQRVIIALAGPVANFILAFAIMVFVFHFHNEVDEYISGPARVNYVAKGSPAEAAGLRGGDTIVHFDNSENPDWESVLRRSALNMNQNVALSYLRDGQRVNTRFNVNVGKATEFNGEAMQSLGMIPTMQDSPIEVNEVDADTPAQRAGLQAGDKILSIDGQQLLSVPALLAYLNDQSGKTSTLQILRNGQTITTQVTPEIGDIGNGIKKYRLGFRYAQPPLKISQLPWGEAIVQSAQENWKNSTMIVEVLKRMFTHQVSVKSLSGPIGIGQQIGAAARDSLWTVYRLMAMISINLGIFNLLPIPILDGGMILMLLVESLIRRDLNQQLKERVYQVAFVCLLLFAAMVIFNDISKLGWFAKLKP